MVLLWSGLKTHIFKSVISNLPSIMRHISILDKWRLSYWLVNVHTGVRTSEVHSQKYEGDKEPSLAQVKLKTNKNTKKWMDHEKRTAVSPYRIWAEEEPYGGSTQKTEKEREKMGCRVFISIGKEAWTQIHRDVLLQLLLAANNPYNTGESWVAWQRSVLQWAEVTEN